MPRQSPKNHILAQLPESTAAAWQPEMETIDLPMGEVLYEPGSVLCHLYFPTTAIVSWVYLLENGASTEIAMTGREGVVGMYMLMGGGKSNNRAIVQKAGQAIRVPLRRVLDSFSQGHDVQRLFWRFTRALITKMAQIAVCHRHHTLDQQLCRMLLLTLNRIDGDTIVMTHEVLASLLGVRREGVSMAAKKLMEDGLVSYSRGRITVHDRAALERRACECYGVIRHEYEQLVDRPQPSAH